MILAFLLLRLPLRTLLKYATNPPIKFHQRHLLRFDDVHFYFDGIAENVIDLLLLSLFGLKLFIFIPFEEEREVGEATAQQQLKKTVHICNSNFANENDDDNNNRPSKYF